MNETTKEGIKITGEFDAYNVLKQTKKVAISGKAEVTGGRNPKAPAINWEQYPEDYNSLKCDKYGTGIVCGYLEEIDKYLVVVDLDDKGEDSFIPMKELLRVFEPLMTKTFTKTTPSGGYHIYLLSNEKPTLKYPSCNIDYQTNTGNNRGKYVLYNYRYNLNGEKEYYIQKDGSPDTILNVDNTDKVMECALNLLDVEYKGKLKPDNENTEAIITICKRNVREGIRNKLSLYLSGYLRKFGYPIETALYIISELFTGSEELDHYIRTAKDSYNDIKDLKDISGYKGLEQVMNGVDLKELKSIVEGKGSTLRGKIMKALAQDKDPSPKILYKYLINKHDFYKDKQTFKFHERLPDGSFIEIDKFRIEELTNEEFGKGSIGTKTCSLVFNWITSPISVNYNLIEFSNGVLNTHTRKFTTDKAINNEIPKLSLPFNWNPEAESGRIGEIIEQILYNSKYPNNKDLWLKVVGHSFMATNSIGKLVIVQGASGTGKSTLSEILKRIFIDSFSEMKIQDIVKPVSQFSLRPLIGKSINIDDDIDNGWMKGIGNLNTIISGNGLQVEVKGKDETIQATNSQIPRLFASGNTLPPVTGSGFPRRLLYIHADNVIAGFEEDDTFLVTDIQQGKYDQNGIEWLIYTSINSFWEFKDSGSSLIDNETKNTMNNDYKYKSYPLKTAMEELFTEENEAYIPLAEVIRILKRYLKIAFKEGLIDIEHTKPKYTNLKRAIDDTTYRIVRKMIEGERTQYVEDIKLKSEWEYLLSSEETAEGQQIIDSICHI